MEVEDYVDDFDVFAFGVAGEEEEEENEDHQVSDGSRACASQEPEDFLHWEQNCDDEVEDARRRPAPATEQEASAVGSTHTGCPSTAEADTDWVLVQDRRQLPLPAYGESDNLRYALGAATGVGLVLAGPAAAALTGLLGIALLKRDQSHLAEQGRGEVDPALAASAERRRMFWRFDLQVDHLRGDLARMLKQQYKRCQESVRKHVRGDIEAVTAQLDDALQREAEQYDFLERVLREYGCGFACDNQMTNMEMETLSSRKEVMESLLHVLDGSRKVVMELEGLRWNSRVAERTYEDAIRERETQLQKSFEALFKESSRVEEHKQQLEEAQHKFSQIEEELREEIEGLNSQVEEARRRQEETEAKIDTTLQTASDRLNAKDRAAKKQTDDYETKLSLQRVEHDRQVKEIFEEVARQRSAHQEALEALADLQKELHNERENSKVKDQELADKHGMLEEKDDWIDCVICKDAAKAMVFMPCGHNACCQTCAQDILQNIRSCPICRTTIKSLVPYVTS